MYIFDTEHGEGRRHGNADAMSRGPCRHCEDEQCIMRVFTRSWKKKGEGEGREVQEEETQVKREEKQPATEKRRRRGRPRKIREPKPVLKKMEEEDDTPTGATDQDVTRDTNIPWLSDSILSLERIKEAQKRDPIISCFIELKEAGDKPDGNDISAQGSGRA